MSTLATARRFALLTLLVGATALAFPAGARERRAPQLSPLWADLDLAREYRGNFAETTDQNTRDRVLGVNAKSHTDVVADYDPLGFPGKTPRDVFRDLLGIGGDPGAPSFAEFLGEPGPLGSEALLGYREALNEYVAGETLIGNQSLLQGLRSRYPRTSDPGGDTQLSLLETSAGGFLAAVQEVGDIVRADPAGFRPGGTRSEFAFPFFVENTPREGEIFGEIVEADYFRHVDLVNRYGVAGNALAKRKFFFGNDTPASRDDAALEFRKTAQNVHLSAILLAAAQSAEDFQNNNGGELDRQITLAQLFYDDIQNGFNPLSLRGDFVPVETTDTVFTKLETPLQSAICTESTARDAARTYDEDQTQLVQELRDQTQDYLDQIGSLLSLPPPFPRPGDTECDPPEQLACNFEKREDRDRLLDLASDEHAAPQLRQRSVDYLRSCDGVICANFVNWQAAQIELRQAQQALKAIAEQIEIEGIRSGTITRIIRNNAASISALELSQGLAVALTPDVNVSFNTADGGWTFGTSFSPGAAIAASFQERATRQQGLADIELEQNESAATIKNLTLQLAAADLSSQRAAVEVGQARGDYTASVRALSRVLRNFAGSRAELAGAFFSNPAYQLALERSAQNAEQAFEEAMVQAYRATKALEYEWAERLSNPVQNPNGLDPTIGGAVFDPIVRAESVFTVRSAGTSTSLPAPSLQTYVASLESWDTTMRTVKGPARQEGSRVRSLKRDILGFRSGDPVFDRIAFRSYVAAHRVPGSNPQKEDLVIEFPLQIFDGRLLPALPNLKIRSVEVELKSIPNRDLLENNPPFNPPLVDVVLTDQAMVRTFSGNNDEFLTIDLEGSRLAVQSQFFMSIQATTDRPLVPGTPNASQAGRSPAVSRWVLRFDMINNPDLILENLDDIEIRINYVAGHPASFTFSDVLPCP